MVLVRDQWGGDAPQRVLAKKWTGETWFFAMGHAPAENPLRRRVVRRLKGKQRLPSEVPESEIISGLHTGSGVRREGLGATLSGMGIERIKLGAAQRRCLDLAAYYTVHLAWGAVSDARDALLR